MASCSTCQPVVSRSRATRMADFFAIYYPFLNVSSILYDVTAFPWTQQASVRHQEARMTKPVRLRNSLHIPGSRLILQGKGRRPVFKQRASKARRASSVADTILLLWR